MIITRINKLEKRLLFLVGSQETISTSTAAILSVSPTESKIDISLTPNPYDSAESISLFPASITNVNGTAFSGDKYALFTAIKALMDDVGGSTAPSVSTGYTRPSDWLEIPSVGASEEVAYFVHAVWDSAVNPCALLFSGGNYIVEVLSYAAPVNMNAGVKWETNFVYASVTSAVSTRGYKTVIIKVTPQAGQTITGFSLDQRHSSYSYYYTTGLLDISINFAGLTSIGFYSSTVLHDNLENIHCKSIGSVTALDYCFYLFRGLKKINAFDTSNVTSISYMFKNSGILEMPLFNFGNVTNATQAFAKMYSLLKLGALDFRKVTTMQSLMEASSVTDASELQLRDLITVYLMGYNNFNLQKFPNFSACNSIAGNIDYTFYGHSINEYPAINLANVTSMTNWLYGQSTLSQKHYRKINAFGAKITHSIANHLLDAAAINAYFTGLGTANSGATLTITGNPGAGSHNASIATAKGWTIIN